jgi:hypothetical protein
VVQSQLRQIILDTLSQEKLSPKKVLVECEGAEFKPHFEKEKKINKEELKLKRLFLRTRSNILCKATSG